MGVLSACGGTPDPSSPDAGDPLPSGPLVIQLVPQAGIAGAQRVSFTVPLPAGVVADVGAIQVAAGGVGLPAARRSLAVYGDGTTRSVLVQVDVDDISSTSELEVSLAGAPIADGLEAVPVADTLLANGAGPRVWALLPAAWLAASGVAGPAVADARIDGTALDAWDTVCDYERFDAEAFVSVMDERGPWLYDRVTALYRAYARSGSASALASAHREAFLYFDGLTGEGADTRIGVPTAEGDLKYHYSQGLALHYLLTGDERYRERAEDLADRAAALWTSPGYAGGTDFWTERHAGFGLLAQVWAATVSDDRAEELLTRADVAVAAYVELQDTYPVGYDDAEARCFAHDAAAHDEPYGYFGCSPWMSAILADGLDAYARLRAGTPAGASSEASIVKLGRAIARRGLDDQRKPYYWMGLEPATGEVDPYDEHWGEPAYVVAMAWHWDGRRDPELRATADELVASMGSRGEVPHIRSFNWQCRSAPMTPWFLLP
ncbi:MAG TPA: hypothetical protein VML75_21450 [Kofleriaceae bacterium]|nr:hypothetical protein [Kofleriaceae bacterium]